MKETERGYDLIAEKFSQTRIHFWRGLEFLRDYAHDDERVFDWGCGNGRLLEILKDISGIQYFGTDVSQKLIDLAIQKYPSQNFHFSKLSSNQTSVPFDDEYFKTVYSIAVMHHIPSVAIRESMVKEMHRIVSQDGHVVVTVWNLWQKKYIGNIMKNWALKIVGLSRLDWNDCRIRFRDNHGNEFWRFHHAFTAQELQRLFEAAGFKTERCEIVRERNIVYIGKKEKQG